MESMPHRLHRAGDPLWWCLAAVLGLGCLRLPSLLDINDQATLRMVGQAGFLFAGIFLGFLRPERVWRWGIASLLLIPAIDLSIAMNGPIFPPSSLLDCLPWLASRTPQYIVRALPAIIGAYFGAYLAKI